MSSHSHTTMEISTLSQRPAMNVPLLNQVIAHITQHPDSCAMSHWATQAITYDKTSETRFQEGARACIGGWAVLLHDGHVNPGSGISQRAQEVLWLDDEQAQNLFLPMHWPRAFYSRLIDAAKGFLSTQDRTEYGRVVCERIQSFIVSDGRDSQFDNGHFFGTECFILSRADRPANAVNIDEICWGLDDRMNSNHDWNPVGLLAQIAREQHQQHQQHQQQPVTVSDLRQRDGQSGYVYVPEGRIGFSIEGHSPSMEREQTHTCVIIDDPYRPSTAEQRENFLNWIGVLNHSQVEIIGAVEPGPLLEVDKFFIVPDPDPPRPAAQRVFWGSSAADGTQRLLTQYQRLRRQRLQGNPAPIHGLAFGGWPPGEALAAREEPAALATSCLPWSYDLSASEN